MCQYRSQENGSTHTANKRWYILVHVYTLDLYSICMHVLIMVLMYSTILVLVYVRVSYDTSNELSGRHKHEQHEHQ